MTTTIHERRRSDASRARAFRASKKQRIERGCATPDRRDVAEALCETVVRELRLAGVAGTTASIPLARLVKTTLGCLVRDGFERTASKASMHLVLDRRFDGPEPELFANGQKDQVWTDWQRAHADSDAAEIEATLAALRALGDVVT